MHQGVDTMIPCYFPCVDTLSTTSFACFMDALDYSRVCPHVSTVTPCHDPSIYIIDSCKARLLSVPHHIHALSCTRACAHKGVLAITPCHNGLDLGPQTHAP
ncbi:hypothetical protein SLA2020_010150 [Shorea laevis]